MEITLGGRRAFYTTGGRPWQAGLPSLVLVHGAGCNQSVWISQSRALAHDGWNVAAVDLPGHGTSEDRAEIASVEDYSEWLGEFVDAMGGKRVVLVGHSMGAGISLTCAARLGERLVGLVLLGCQAAMRVHPQLLEDTRDRPENAARFIAAHGHGRGSHVGGAPVPGTWLLGSALALLESCPSPVLHRDFLASHRWEGLALTDAIHCPTLVLSGEADRMTPARGGRQLATAISRGRCEVIPGAGHFLMNEAPRTVLKSMRAFLDNLEP